jgi:triple functional domain protein
MGVTEHIEGDECKFATWTGRVPMAENKVILKASSIESKHNWVKKMRQMIQETYFNTALPSISARPLTSSKHRGSNHNNHIPNKNPSTTGSGKSRFSRYIIVINIVFDTN